jgi:hypothetical protein
MTTILERGDIFSLYRPKLNATFVHGSGDVQRFYTTLKLPDSCRTRMRVGSAA